MEDDSANLEAKLAELERENRRLREEIARLKLQVMKLQKMLFGRKSERQAVGASGQLLMAELLTEVERLNGAILANEKELLVTRQATLARKPRRNLDELVTEGLPVEVIEHDLPEADKVDLVSGLPLKRIGEERVRKLAYRPGQCFIKEHVYFKYAAPANPAQGVVCAPAPDFAIPGGSYDESFLAMVAFEKVAMHLPLYRIEERLHLMGINVGRQTLSRLYIASAEVLIPLMVPFKEEILGRGVIFTDDTPVDLIEQGSGKTITGRMWVYVAGGEGPPPAHLRVHPRPVQETAAGVPWRLPRLHPCRRLQRL